jgi:hypothetical protein
LILFRTQSQKIAKSTLLAVENKTVEKGGNYCWKLLILLSKIINASQYISKFDWTWIILTTVIGQHLETRQERNYHRSINKIMIIES